MSSQRKKSFKVSFDTKVKTRTFQVESDMVRHQHIKQTKQKLYPNTYDCPKPKEADTLEAIRCAKSLSETLQASDLSPKCDFECDHQPLGPSDLCCRCCRVIPKEEMPKYARVSSTPARSKGTRWLGDTGTDQDIVGESQQVVTKSNIREADVNITLSTANGPITADRSIDTHIPALCEGFSPYVLKDSPPALSIGQRCLEDGYDFVWGRDNKPIFVRPDNEVVQFKMSSRVPFLDDECYPVAVPEKLVSALRRSIENINEYVSQHSFSTPAEKAVDDAIEAEVEEQLRNPPEPEYAGEEGGTEENSEEEDQTEDEIVETEDEGVDEIDINPPTDDEQDRVYGNKTEEELRKDAISPEHLFTHRPKNPYCETCKRAKMMRPYATRKGGSRHVKSNKFGDHIVADHVIMKRSVETGVQDEHVMMVVKDVYTQYRYAYPSDSKSTDEIIKGFNHFLKSTDRVGVVYTDNSPEFCAAIKEYGVVHQTSVEYLDSTKSVVEREARTMLEGARSNLVQANIDISMWPYAVRHHCMAMNLSEQLTGDRSPWDLRNKRDFSGKIIPFGCLVYFWEDRKRPDSIAGKMSPSSAQGVFLGYHIQAGHVWRDEYLVAHLDGLDYRLADGSVKVIRTKRLELPDGDFVFPLRKDQQISVMDVDCDFEPSSDEGGPDDDDLDGDDGRGDGGKAKDPPPRDMPNEDHPASVEVEPPTEKGSVDDLMDVIEDLGEGHEPSSSSSSKPPKKDEKKKDYSWFDLFYDDTVDPYKMPDGKPVPKGYVHDGVRLVRHRKGSKRVPGYPSDLWGRLSLKERNRRWEEYQKKLEDKDKDKSKGTCAPQANVTGDSHEHFAAPAMPVEQCDYEPHCSNMRALVEDKLSEIQKKLDFDLFANVARVLTKHEISKSPGAQKALDAEWEKLLNKKTWDQSRVKECRSIVEDAKRKGEKVHIGRIFEICTLKGSELPEGDPNRKHKGRTCFQGNNVFDESSDYAIFAEMSSSPASMEAAKILDAYGSQPCHSKEQADARQAYTQAIFTGVPTWLRLPRNRWPKDWQRLYKDPLVPMLLALYGHPDSGGIWEKHFEDRIATKGWVPVLKEIWKSLFFNPSLNLLLVVYVDDLKMAGPTENMKKGWSSISSVIDIDDPEPYGRYFGCEHEEQNGVKLKPRDHPFEHVFTNVSSVAAVSQHRTNDFWEHDQFNGTWTRHHIYPRKKLFHPRDCENSVPVQMFTDERITMFDGTNEEIQDSWKNKGEEDQKKWWTGKTIFKSSNLVDPEARHAAAAKAKPGTHRKKSAAKRLAREQRFTSMENLNVKKGGCMEKPVNIVKYNMKNFLESCVEAYCQLAKVDKNTLKRASTPFHDNKVARPKEDDEKSGRLQPIASKVLMKILFAARMARYDLLRATQSLASRVTKWSEDCDIGLHRLVSYINSTLDLTMHSFTGDRFRDCQLCLFADADFAGEHDSKSTTGSYMVLVGPNTYFPINAFSKKQTAITMSSTEAEVIAANHAVRTQGLPSLSLFNYILALTDPEAPTQVKAKSAGLTAKPKVPKQNDPVSIACIDPELDELRYGYFHNVPETVANINHLQLHTGPTFNVKFMEDNQATITILTNGSSTQMRHTDRTQRVSFGWLKQQFESNQFDLINVNTNYQAADILTKPFTSPAKWENAIHLLGMKYEKKPSLAASRGDGDYDRLLVEVCCSEDSKLGQNRQASTGCKIIRITEKDDATKESTINELISDIRDFHNQGGRKVMIHFSLPCTGGCSWNHINKDNPGGIERIKDHQRLFKRLFFNATWLIEMIKDINPIITMELPTGTEYWKWSRVKKFLKYNNMEKYSFHGCSFGLRNKKGEFLKKGWTIASNESSFQVFKDYKCTKDHRHGSSRGKDLKEAESYTFEMTDLMHKTFREITQSCSTVACTSNNCDSLHSNTCSDQQSSTCVVAMASATASVPTSSPAKLSFSADESRRLDGLAECEHNKIYQDLWKEELVFASYNLMRMQSARVAEVDETIEGILTQYHAQIILETWYQSVWDSTAFSKVVQLSDVAFGYLRDPDPFADMPLAGGRPKRVWVVVSDSGMILLSGSKRNRQFYEPHAEFQQAKPADVDNLVVRPMWGKKLHHLFYELDAIVKQTKSELGKDTEVIATIYWNGNELVGPEGIEDERRWPFRSSRLDVGNFYNEMHDRLRQLATIASRCTAFALVTGPNSEFYDFGADWDSFYKTFKGWCKELSVRYVDATLVAEHIEKVDQYHGRKTVANVTKLVSFFTSLLQVLQVDLKMNRFEPAFDSLLARKLELTYDEANEITSDDTAAAQKGSYLAMKQKVVQHRIAQLGPSRMFTVEQIEELPPVDEQLTKNEIEEMTGKAVKIEVENVSHIVDPMDVDAGAPRKRQAENVDTGASIKQRAVSFDLPTTSSSVLGASEKAAPTLPKIATATKSKPEVQSGHTSERPDPPELPSSSSSVSRPDPPPLPSEVSKSIPPPPKGVSAAAPPPRQRNQTVDRIDYFDMAVNGLPGHALLVPQDVERKQEVRISVPGALQVLPLEPMLGSQLKNLPGIDYSKVPRNIKALRAVSGVMRGYMSDWLEKRTDYHGYAHIDDVKRKLLTGGFKREVQNWNIEVFMSIAAFDEKDRFEVLTASGVNQSLVQSDVLAFKIRCVQGHQEKFLSNRNPTIGAVRVFCHEDHQQKYPKHLVESGTANMPPRIFHRTSKSAAVEIIRHGLVPGGVGVCSSGRRHSYLSPFQVTDTKYKSGVRADQPIEVAVDTELALRSGVDLTLTSSDAIITSDHIPNACILWVKDTKSDTFIYSLTDGEKRAIYEQAMYGDQRASDVFGQPAPSGAQDEAPTAGSGRDAEISAGTRQVKHFNERPPADDEADVPMTGVARQNLINAPSTLAAEIEQVKSYGTIPTGTYVALPESPCPRCTNNLIEGMFTCMCCGYVITSSKRSERTMRIYQKRAEILLELSERSKVRINADNFLQYWTGEDVTDRAFVTWEADQIRRARQRLTRAMKLGFFNIVHRYRRDNVYAASLANVNKDLKDCVLLDTLAVLRLPGVERTAGQRAVGTGPMERINKHDRIHVAKVCYLTVTQRLLHDEYRDPNGGDWFIFWHQQLFTLTKFVQAIRQAGVEGITIMTFSNRDQGFTDFQLKGLDDGERRAMLQEDFDQHQQVAATQHYQSDVNSKQNRKVDPVLEDVERKREDESLTPPEEALSRFPGYDIRPSKKLVPKEPAGPPPMHLRRPAEPALPPDVRDPPAVERPASAAARPAEPDFQLRTAGRWRWDRNFGDWIWEQQFNPLETDPYSPYYRPSDSILNNWMGNGWIDWTARFGFRNY